PLMIYNIGASNLLSDMCTEFTSTASLPCSYDIPISCSKYLLVARKVDNNDQETLIDIPKDQVIVETNYNYVEDLDTMVYSREDFGLENDSFIGCIVGNRLDSEIDDDFIDLIKNIITETDIHIVFIGTIEDKKRIIDKMSDNKSRLHFLGHQLHAKAIIRLTNIYINPKRKGGGRSCFEALSYGIPVVTPNIGDVYYTCNGTISATNYKEMYSSIIECYSDQDYYKKISNQASLRAVELSNIVATQKDVIDNILAFELHKTV
ncbi:MAG: glycosyltransferase, partial [Anaerolineaceae bacterium]